MRDSRSREEGVTHGFHTQHHHHRILREVLHLNPNPKLITQKSWNNLKVMLDSYSNHEYNSRRCTPTSFSSPTFNKCCNTFLRPRLHRRKVTTRLWLAFGCDSLIFIPTRSVMVAILGAFACTALQPFLPYFCCSNLHAIPKGGSRQLYFHQAVSSRMAKHESTLILFGSEQNWSNLLTLELTSY